MLQEIPADQVGNAPDVTTGRVFAMREPPIGLCSAKISRYEGNASAYSLCI